MKSKNKIMSLAEASTTFRDLQTKYDGLTAKLSEKQNERSTLAASLQNERRSKAQIERDRRVSALLGKAPADDGLEGPATLAKLDVEIADLKVAIGIVESELATERTVASRVVCERASADYVKIVRQMAHALVELESAHSDYARFTSDLNAENIAWPNFLRPVGMKFIANPGDPHGRVASWLKEAIEYRLIPADFMPKELRRA